MRLGILSPDCLSSGQGVKPKVLLPHLSSGTNVGIHPIGAVVRIE